jgi:hypothetical protein
MQFQFDCVYGSNHTQDIGYYYNGWYVVDGSTNVNYTIDLIDKDGVTDVEELIDLDTFTWSAPIYSLEELINAVNDDN